jgi:hypothetical protein
VSAHRAIARLIESREPCVSASGSLVLQHGSGAVPIFVYVASALRAAPLKSGQLGQNKDPYFSTARESAPRKGPSTTGQGLRRSLIRRIAIRLPKPAEVAKKQQKIEIKKA